MKRYYITDRKAVGGFRPLMEVIRDQLHLGVDYIQIREKDLSARELAEFSLAVLEVRENGRHTRQPTKIILNSRADVALAIGADGVHLPADAPRQTLPGLLVIRSCHSVQEVKNAQADFIVFGPIFQGHGDQPLMGLEQLRAAAAASPKPVFALGGVDWDNAAKCMAAGAEGIAGIRLFQDPSL
jgi:thiamine-phosphate pyrophosphorylase